MARTHGTGPHIHRYRTALQAAAASQLAPARAARSTSAVPIDPAADAAVCPFCNTPFVVEKAVNYYNARTTTGSVGHVEHLHVDDARSVEARLRSAEDSLVKLHDYGEAHQVFKSVAADSAGEWRAWWGMARAATHDLGRVLCHPELREAEDCVRRAKAIAAPDARDRIDRQWSTYRAKVRRARDEAYARLGLDESEAKRLGALCVAEASRRCQELKTESTRLANRIEHKCTQVKGARNRLLVPVVAVIALIPVYHLVEQVPFGSGAVSVLWVLVCAVFWIAARIFLGRREADGLEQRLSGLVAERDRLKADLDNRARLEAFWEKWGKDGEAA